MEFPRNKLVHTDSKSLIKYLGTLGPSDMLELIMLCLLCMHSLCVFPKAPPTCSLTSVLSSYLNASEGESEISKYQYKVA